MSFFQSYDHECTATFFYEPQYISVVSITSRCVRRTMLCNTQGSVTFIWSIVIARAPLCQCVYHRCWLRGITGTRPPNILLGVHPLGNPPLNI